MNTKNIKSGTYFDIAVTTDPSGRTSIVVNNMYGCIVDVELPAQKGEFKEAFKPTVKAKKEVEIEKLGD